MANSLLTPSVIAKEALMQLDNNLIVAKKVYRDYEAEFGATKVGDTVSIRRPVQYNVREGATIDVQDTVEGKINLQVDKQRGVDMEFPSDDLTLTIEDFSERYVTPAMIQLANRVDRDLLLLYKDVWNWVGTPGQTINSFADFSKGPERLDEGAVPHPRCAILTPADHWALAANFTSLNIDSTAKTALERARLPMVGDVDTYKAQNVATHTVGAGFAADGGTTTAVQVRGASQTKTYLSVKDTFTQTLSTDHWLTPSLAINKGDVFTIAGVYAVNPVTKQALDFLQPFTVVTGATTAATTGANTDVVITPPIITSGPYQTVSAAPADNAAITPLGTVSTNYRQNLMFHKNAFALVMVPMVLPQGAAMAARESRNGFSVRMVSAYDITNDKQTWRFDVLYGVKAIDPRLATRVSGTA